MLYRAYRTGITVGYFRGYGMVPTVLSWMERCILSSLYRCNPLYPGAYSPMVSTAGYRAFIPKNSTTLK